MVELPDKILCCNNNKKERDNYEERLGNERK